VKIPGFDKTPTAKLRRNRINYAVMLLLWVGFVVFTIAVNGETQTSTWVGVAVIALVGAIITLSELELRRRAKAGDESSVD